MMTVLEERYYQTMTHSINRIANSLEHIEKMLAEGMENKECEEENGKEKTDG